MPKLIDDYRFVPAEGGSVHIAGRMDGRIQITAPVTDLCKKTRAARTESGAVYRLGRACDGLWIAQLMLDRPALIPKLQPFLPAT